MIVHCFHGTSQEFDVPRPLTHFGTRQAAVSAPRYRGTLMEFDLVLENPLRVPDSPGGGDTWEWLRSAADAGIVTEDQFLAWEKKPTDGAFIDLLAARGYDGLVYRNEFEASESMSWVIFHGAQATRTDPAPTQAP